MTRRLFGFLVALAVSSPLAAQRQEIAERGATDAWQKQAAREQRALGVSGRTVSRAVRKLKGKLHWYKTLKTAAAAAEKSGKPIVWIHALGSLHGYT